MRPGTWDGRTCGDPRRRPHVTLTVGTGVRERTVPEGPARPRFPLFPLAHTPTSAKERPSPPLPGPPFPDPPVAGPGSRPHPSVSVERKEMSRLDPSTHSGRGDLSVRRDTHRRRGVWGGVGRTHVWDGTVGGRKGTSLYDRTDPSRHSDRWPRVATHVPVPGPSPQS